MDFGLAAWDLAELVRVLAVRRAVGLGAVIISFAPLCAAPPATATIPALVTLSATIGARPRCTVALAPPRGALRASRGSWGV